MAGSTWAQCWISGPASLCSEDQRLVPDPQLRLHLKQFPSTVWRSGCPSFQWQGQLNADLLLDLPPAGRRARLWWIPAVALCVSKIRASG